MKICICSDGYPSPGIPYSAFIQVLSREMVRQGHEVIIVAPQSLTKHVLRKTKLAPRRFKDMVSVKGHKKEIKVYRPYSVTFGEGVLGWLTPKFNRWATERLIKREKLSPDIFYAHFWANGYNIVRVAHSCNTPFFVATGEDKINFTDFVSEEDVGKVYTEVSGVICVSSKNKEESIRLGLTKEDKCIILPNAYDPQEFYQIDKNIAKEKLGFTLDDYVVAFCGRFNHRKGAMRVAEAIKQLNTPDIKSIFIGDIADNESAQPDCNGIIFKGILPHKDIVHYLNCADVFVLPSLAEGCPNSVIEAMACGLPIISSDLPFNYDILDSSNSILVDPMDVNEIANAIITLKEDETLRSKLSKGAIKKVSELTIEKRVSKILNFIREKCGKVE